MHRIVDSRCVLAVRDLQASTRFYVDVLGFRRDFGDGSDGWSFLSRDAFKIMLVEIRTRTGVPCERSRWEVAPDGQTLHRSVESAIDGHYTLVYEEVFDKADSENLIPSIAPSPP